MPIIMDIADRTMELGTKPLGRPLEL